MHGDISKEEDTGLFPGQQDMADEIPESLFSSWGSPHPGLLHRLTIVENQQK